MDKLAVRAAAPSDRERIFALYDEVIADTEGKPTSPMWERGIHPSDEEVDRAIAEGNLYVAVSGTRVVAALIADGNAPAGYENVPWSFDFEPGEIAIVHLFAVSPSLQHAGLGTRFLSSVFNLLAQRGMRGVRLDTLEGNEPARRFYVKMGMDYLGVHTLEYFDPRVSRFHLFDLRF